MSKSKITNNNNKENQIEVFKSQNSYFYDHSKEQWEYHDFSKYLTEGNFKVEKNLSVGAFNVLFGHKSQFINSFMRNQQRYKLIINKLLPQVDADIQGLCEVNSSFLNLMKKNQFIQDKHYISYLKRIYPDKRHEMMMISKYPFRSYYINIPSQLFLKRYLDEETPFIIIQAHLYSEEKYSEVRRSQMEDISSIIQRIYEETSMFETDTLLQNHLKTAVQNNNIILHGDMNFILKYETQFIYDQNFSDLWLDKHGNSEGSESASWCTRSNSLLQLLVPIDMWFRLDRQMLHKDCKTLKLEDISIQGKEQIGTYLSYSDHFMLLSKFQIQRQNSQRQMENGNGIMAHSSHTLKNGECNWRYDFQKNKQYYESKKLGFHSYRQLKPIGVIRQLMILFFIGIMFLLMGSQVFSLIF